VPKPKALRDAALALASSAPRPLALLGSRATAFVPHGLGDPNCPHCHGLGYVRDERPLGDPEFGRIYTCACRLAELENSKSPSDSALLGLVPPADKTFQTFQPSGVRGLPYQRASLRLAYDTSLKYAEAPRGWLLLQGRSGSGKTHLASAIANARLNAGDQVIFASASGLLDRLRQTFDPLAWESYDHVFDQMRACALLIIDDLGDESPTPWALEKLYQLFNHRSVSALPTVITTRLPLERIEPRIRSRSMDIDLVRKLLLDAPNFNGDPDSLTQLSDLSHHSQQTFETFDLRETETRIAPLPLRELRTAYECARNFALNPQGWLVLAGGRANGKTHLAAAIGNYCAQQDWPCIFLTTSALLRHLHVTFNPGSPVLYDEVFADLKSAPILILDDLRFNRTSTWARDKIAHLLDYRHLAKLPTVITMPHKLNELGELFEVRLLDPMLSVVCELSTPAFGGVPYRPKRERR